MIPEEITRDFFRVFLGCFRNVFWILYKGCFPRARVLYIRWDDVAIGRYKQVQERRNSIKFLKLLFIKSSKGNHLGLTFATNDRIGVRISGLSNPIIQCNFIDYLLATTIFLPVRLNLAIPISFKTSNTSSTVAVLPI